MTALDLRVHVVEARQDVDPLPADAETRCRRALQAAAARLGVDLGAGTPPLPTWTVILERPTEIRDYAALYGLVAPRGTFHEGLTWAGGSMVPHLDEATLLHHEAGHWLAHHAGLADLADWRASERCARRAEGPGWLARLFGRADPGAAFVA